MSQRLSNRRGAAFLSAQWPHRQAPSSLFERPSGLFERPVAPRQAPSSLFERASGLGSPKPFVFTCFHMKMHVFEAPRARSSESSRPFQSPCRLEETPVGAPKGSKVASEQLFERPVAPRQAPSSLFERSSGLGGPKTRVFTCFYVKTHVFTCFYVKIRVFEAPVAAKAPEKTLTARAIRAPK